jgi:hypothetical protein
MAMAFECSLALFPSVIGGIDAEEQEGKAPHHATLTLMQQTTDTGAHRLRLPLLLLLLLLLSLFILFIALLPPKMKR